MSLGRPLPGPSHMPPRFRTTTTRSVELNALLASTRRSRSRRMASGSSGSGTCMAFASRDMRAQWRSQANSTPSATRSVLKIPQPESNPTWPAESVFADASWISPLCRTKRCNTMSSF